MLHCGAEQIPSMHFQQVYLPVLSSEIVETPISVLLCTASFHPTDLLFGDFCHFSHVIMKNSKTGG